MSESDEDAVRRLLADARHDEPMPAEVVARLERALAAEVTVPESADVAPVSDLARRRRARRGTGLLVAAAAVVAVAVVGPRLGTQHQSEDSGAAADTAGSSAAGGSAQSESGSGTMSAPEAAPTSPDRLFSALAARGVTAIGSATFDADVAALADEPPPTAAPRDVAFDCAPADWGAGTLVPVTYDGAPAVLAYRPDGTTVDLLACGTGDVIRSTALPGE